MTQTQRSGRLSAAQCRHPFRRPPRAGSVQTRSNLALPRRDEDPEGSPSPRSPPHRPARARTPASPALPSPRGSSPRTPQLPGERYLSPARPPSLRRRAHRSESFPCWSSPSLSPPGPSLCRVSRPRLTTPGVPAARAHARTLRPLTQPRGREAATETTQALEPRLLSGPLGHQQPEVKPRGQGEREGARQTESEN